MTTVGPPETGEGVAPAPRVIGKDWRARIPFFYGWVIVVAALLSLGLTYSIWYSFSVFYVALLRDFHWSRASTASIFSTFVIVGGIASPVSGALVDRFGPGRVVAIGGAVLAAGMLICSGLTELWQFYLAFGVVAALGTCQHRVDSLCHNAHPMVSRSTGDRTRHSLGRHRRGYTGRSAVSPGHHPRHRVACGVRNAGCGRPLRSGIHWPRAVQRWAWRDLGQQIDGRDPSDSPLAKAVNRPGERFWRWWTRSGPAASGTWAWR